MTDKVGMGEVTGARVAARPTIKIHCAGTVRQLIVNLTIRVNGEEKSLSAFGMEVLRTNEEGATQATMEYLQHNFLGPIDIEETKLLFRDSGELNAMVTGQVIQGNWQLINNRTI